MNLRQLRYFVAVAQEQHFGRAARRLHVSQPPLSQQIKALEEELGCQLFARTTRRVELTAAGEALFGRAERLLEDLEAAVAHTREVERGHAGLVRASFVGSATYDLLPTLVRTVREELPAVELHIESERLTPEQEDALVDGRVDLAVLSVRDEGSLSPQLEIHARQRVPLIVALDRNHRLARRRSVRVGELAAETFLMHPAGGRSVLHQTVRALCREAGFQPRVAHAEVRETVTAVSLAAAGMGVAVLPGSIRALRVVGAVYRPLVCASSVPNSAPSHPSDAGHEAPGITRALATRREALPTTLTHVLSIAAGLFPSADAA